MARAKQTTRVGGKTYKKGAALPAQASRAKDPAQGSRDIPPNYGRFVFPQVVSFQGRQGLASQAYRSPDEALRHNAENARAMRRDCSVMECLEARQRGTALLNWHLEVPDKKDPRQKMLVDQLTKIIEGIPRFTEYRRNLLEAIWYGRYAVQHRFEFEHREGHRFVVIKDWRPIHGDKLMFRWDDGSGQYEDGQVGIRWGMSWGAGDALAGDRKMEYTEQGPAYFLEHWERTKIAVHKHLIEDGEYEDVISAGRIHGVGIRDRIYWCWYQKQETMANLMEVIERTGNGFTIYWYPYGNDEAKKSVETMAESQGNTNVLVMPRNPGDPTMDAFGIDRIEPSTAGIDAMKGIIHEFFGHQIKRYILGQTLSTEATATGMGSGVADLHQESFLSIIEYDAKNLEETITVETVTPLKNFNFAWAMDIPVKFRIDTKSSDSEGKLGAFKAAWDMGAKIKASDVMDVIGASMPQGKDEVLQNPTIAQQLLALQQGPQGGEQAGEGGADQFGGLADTIQSGQVPDADGDLDVGEEGDEPPTDKPPGPQRFSKIAERADNAAAATAKPTDAQKAAGNYRKGTLNFHGLTVKIETPKGELRNPNWKPLDAHYGYIKRTEGADREPLDVFVGPHPESEVVYVVDMPNKAGRFDEHKALIGWKDKAAAMRSLRASYHPGWKFGPVTPLTVGQFRAWLRDGKTRQPIASQVNKYAKDANGAEHGEAGSGHGGQFVGKGGGEIANKRSLQTSHVRVKAAIAAGDKHTAESWSELPNHAKVGALKEYLSLATDDDDKAIMRGAWSSLSSKEKFQYAERVSALAEPKNWKADSAEKETIRAFVKKEAAAGLAAKEWRPGKHLDTGKHAKRAAEIADAYIAKRESGEEPEALSRDERKSVKAKEEAARTLEWVDDPQFETRVRAAMTATGEPEEKIAAELARQRAEADKVRYARLKSSAGQKDIFGGEATGKGSSKSLWGDEQENLHPRGDDGRWVSKEELHAAKSDHAAAKALRERVTKPEELAKLDGQIGESGKERAPQRDLLGNEIAPPKPKANAFEDLGGEQQALFGTAGQPGQMNLFADKGVPDEMVQKGMREGGAAEIHAALSHVKQLGTKWNPGGSHPGMFDTKREAVAVRINQDRANAARESGQPEGSWKPFDGDFRAIATEAEIEKLFPKEAEAPTLDKPISTQAAIEKANKKNEPEGGWTDEHKVPADQQSATPRANKPFKGAFSDFTTGEKAAYDAHLADAKKAGKPSQAPASFLKEQRAEGATAEKSGPLPLKAEPVAAAASESDERAKLIARLEAEVATEKARSVPQAAKSAAKLRSYAATMAEQAEESLGRDRKTNTHKRAGEAAHAIKDANNNAAMAKTLLNIADHLESGDATHLKGIKTKAMVETLDAALRRGKSNVENKMDYHERQNQPEGFDERHVAAAEYPHPWVYGNNVRDLLETVKGKPGAPQLRDALGHLSESGRITSEKQIDALRDLATLSAKHGARKWDVERLKDSYANYDRMQSAGITPDNFREALHQYHQLRATSDREPKWKAMERALVGNKLPGFFPTPKPVVERMLSQADIKHGEQVLEPSAGNGAVADAIRRQHSGASLSAVERSHTLRDILAEKGHSVVGDDFLSHSGQYDKIVMNPPFEDGAEIDHVRHAYEQLKPGGRIVSVMSTGPFHRSDKKAAGFREWLEGVEHEHEDLPAGSFNNADNLRTTGVSTKLVTIHKPTI